MMMLMILHVEVKNIHRVRVCIVKVIYHIILMCEDIKIPASICGRYCNLYIHHGRRRIGIFRRLVAVAVFYIYECELT